MNGRLWRVLSFDILCEDLCASLRRHVSHPGHAAPPTQRSDDACRAELRPVAQKVTRRMLQIETPPTPLACRRAEQAARGC